MGACVDEEPIWNSIFGIEAEYVQLGRMILITLMMCTPYSVLRHGILITENGVRSMRYPVIVQ